MIKLISLSFSGIGRFIDRQFIEFSSKEKLLQIDGINQNTGGSSGAGKSTIFHALDYALGISDIPATTLQSRLTKNPLSVEVELEIDGKKVIVNRSKKDGLTISVDGEVTSGNVKAAEEQLDFLISVPKKIFKKMIHKKQKEGGFFLDLTAKESYEFLTKALGLGELTNKILLIEQDVKKNKEELISVQKHQSILISEIETSKKDMEMFSVLEKPSLVYIEEIQSKMDDSNKEINSLEKELRDITSQAENYKPLKSHIDVSGLLELVKKLEVDKSVLENSKNSLLSNVQNKKTSLLHEVKQTEAKLNRIPYLRNQISKLIQDMKNLMEERSHIEKSECPTCRQLWAGNSAKYKLDTIQTKVETIKKEILEIKTQIDLEPELLNQLSRQNSQILDHDSSIKNTENSYLGKITSVMTEISDTKNKISNIQREADLIYSQELNEHKLVLLTKTQKISEKIMIQKNTSALLKGELDTLNNQIKMHEKSLQMKNLLEDKLNKQTSELCRVNSNQLIIEKNIAIAEESKRLIKSYSLQKFQETLNSIGETASEILKNVPNMTTASVYFEGCKETNSGSIKEEVTAFINMDGESDIDIKSLSGGERTAVDLAVDLAVIDVLETKAGKGADFFILDEPFDGLDSVGRSAVVDIIKGIDTNKRIMIVDHGSETKEIISDKIIAIRDGEISCVV